ncbi:MAG: pilus assembly protein [Parashewanella sp.]
MNTSKLLFGLMAALTVMAASTFADDTELYVTESSARTGARPKVLIIFDTSGSMWTQMQVKPFYPRNDTLNNSTKLYYSISAADVPNLTSQQQFTNAVNACATSQRYLRDFGMFTGFIREYKFSGRSGSWDELPLGNAGTVSVIDCYDDIENRNPDNGSNFPSGFPVDGEGSPESPSQFARVSSTSSSEDITAAIDRSKLTEIGIGRPITLYTENYVNWYHDNSLADTYTSRLNIAKRAIEDIIVTTPGVDFGLEVFNDNSDGSNNDGGRIINGIIANDTSTRSSLLSTVAVLQHNTWTPLCESLYEAYRYYSGGQVLFGNQNERNLSPRKDSRVISGANYLSPLNSTNCKENAYVVLITDGEPTFDGAADDMVKSLPGVSAADGFDFYNGYTRRNETSFLPALAGYMNSHDINSSIGGEQRVKTFTIGFSSGAASAEPLLRETAKRGGGRYFSALDANELQASLQSAVSEILKTNASFTSPSIASNNFDRTQTHSAVYYAMFFPNEGARWTGNLKKFTVDGNGTILDKNGNAAIGSDGNIKSSSCSIWTSAATCPNSNSGDGNDVKLGGVLEALRGTTSRVLYGDFGSGLTPFTKNNAQAKAGSEAALATYMGVSSAQLESTFQWAIGKDVDDDNENGNRTEMRADVLGDPLHSKPLAIDFGSETSPDIRILMGTNHGFMHMFKDVDATGSASSSVSESWAFMPYELLPNIRELRANVPSGVHSVYGLDASPVAYIKKGTSALEKVWLFFGMRRGGKSYYALDITNPDSPSFKWKINKSTPGFSELGQTWSQPIVTTIKRGADTNKPVLIFGAGYSPVAKDGRAIGRDDTEGRGVYIVDADTGALIHFFGVGGDATSRTTMSGLVDSIPNQVALLDSDGDGHTDRIYATDTGANIWRMDLPSEDKTTWSAFKFAALGGTTQATDRRFFSAPTVAQTMITNVSRETETVGSTTTTRVVNSDIPYDAVVVGSGSRPSPLDKSRHDMFYTLQDRNVVTRSFGSAAHPAPATLTQADLYDVTSTPPTSEAQKIAFSAKRGWFYNFTGDGEKSLAAAAIISGRVFFTSYVPGNSGSTTGNQCLISGAGRLYGFELHRGLRAYRHTFYEMSERVPDTPQLVIPPNGNDPSRLYLIGIGAAADLLQKQVGVIKDGCPPGDNRCVGGGLTAKRIYYYVED